MKKRVALFIVLLSAVVLFTGCSAKSEGEPYYGDEYQVEDTEPTAPPAVVDDATLAGGDVVQSAVIPALENRKIIYTARLGMDAPEPEVIYNNVIDNLDTYSAYIESANLTANRYTVKIRVLSENFTDFVEEIKTTGEVVSFTKSSEDVTNSYSTFEARKLALETQHTRILELIEDAIDLEDILVLEDARFDIERELNEIGSSLANFDSLVDFSTIDLTINRTTDEVVLLPRTSTPRANIIEVSKNTMEVEVYNASTEQVMIYVDLLQNGEFIRQYEADAYGDSVVVFEIDELKSFKEYTFKVTTIAADHRVSNIETVEATTDKTFFNKVANVFITSFTALVSITEFIGLAIVAVSPYAVVGTILYFPGRILYRKYRVKHPKQEKDTREYVLAEETK